MKKDALILFQGDSITDVGRCREDLYDLGPGYPKFVAQLLKKNHPDYRFINKGISGDRTWELLDRWQKDTLDLKPDFISILIGVNDCWRRFDSNIPTSEQQYEENYRKLLTQVKAMGTKIMIIEPYLIHCEPTRAFWRIDLDPKIHVARKLAQEFADIYLPLDGLFAAEFVHTPMNQFSEDGVHPTEDGHRFIASAWVDAFEKFIK